MTHKGKRLVKAARYLVTWGVGIIMLVCVYSVFPAFNEHEYALYALLSAIAVLTLTLLPVLFVGSKSKAYAVEQVEALYFREKAKMEVNALFPSYEHILEPIDFDAKSLDEENNED